jgi:AcrR family transcriptional regulator
VAAGISVADREGLEALSIRRIAADLQSSPMALYHHVPSKRDLLNLMLDGVNAEYRPLAEPVGSWRNLLLHFAWESRRCLNRHPWINAVHAADPEYGPKAIEILENLLTSLQDGGLDRKTAARTLGILHVFVNGFVAAELSGSGRKVRFSQTVLETGKFPQVARFAAEHPEEPEDQGFERALTWILDGIAAEIENQAPQP